jgi:hypothetical protein
MMLLEQPIRGYGSLGLMPIVEHACNATAKKIPEKWIFALAHTHSLIYETGTNLVVFDHTASVTTTVPPTSLIGTNGNSC